MNRQTFLLYTVHKNYKARKHQFCVKIKNYCNNKVPSKRLENDGLIN